MSQDLHELPEGWEWHVIPDLIGDQGLFTDGDWVESKDQDPNGDVRLIQLADVGVSEFRDRSSRFLTSDKAKELRCSFLKPGDILFARMPDPIGRACLFPGDIKQSVTVVDVAIIRPQSENVDHKWLVYQINAPQFYSSVISLQKGATRKRISRKNLSTIKFPLPPLNEQKRIVAKLDALFTRIDTAITHLQQTLELSKALFASALDEKFDYLIKNAQLRQFGDVVVNHDGKRVPIKASERKTTHGTYPYYGATGIIDYVDEYIFDGERLLISEDGANLVARKYPIAFRATGKYWVNNHAHIVDAIPDITSNQFLEVFFAWTDLSKFITGSAQPKLSQKKLNSIVLPVPSLAVCRTFAQTMIQ